MDHDVSMTDGSIGAEARRVAVERRQRATMVRRQARGTTGEREALVAVARERSRGHDALISELQENAGRLRDAVREFALSACAEQMPPERMLVALKETVRAAVGIRGPEAQELMEDVVRWSIDAYYEQSQEPGVTRSAT
jgi:hypothetical protein